MSEHICANYCPRYKDEPCDTCIVHEPEILLRPDEAEILPVAAEATPDCTRCTVYANEIRTQNKIITWLSVTISVLIVICGALFLWGLK